MKELLSCEKVIDFRVRVPRGLYPTTKIPESYSIQYNAVLNSGEKYANSQNIDDLLNTMDENGIDHAVMHAENELGDMADTLNDVLADIVQRYPQRFTGIGTVSLSDLSIKKALRQIDECAEKGFIGLSIQPAFFGMHLNEKKLYPVYAKAMEKNLLVALHTGINYTTSCPMAGENPILLDELACNFPDLTIVASHGGWPWIPEMVAVARKHPQVYVEFGGLSPKYIGAQGGGWDMMHRFMNSVLNDQILYATDYPTMDHHRTLFEWRAMNLKPAVLENLLAKNAKELIRRSFEV